MANTSRSFQEVQKLSMLETTYRFLPGGIIGGKFSFHMTTQYHVLGTRDHD